MGAGWGPLARAFLLSTPGDVVLNGGSTGLFSFSQSQEVLAFEPPVRIGAVGYSLASFTFDFVVAAANPDGDYNNDGTVNLADYTVWRDNLGSADPLPNDPNAGPVGTDAYNTWKGNFGPGAGAVAASQVPEPSSVAILLGLVAATAMATRYRTS